MPRTVFALVCLSCVEHGIFGDSVFSERSGVLKDHEVLSAEDKLNTLTRLVLAINPILYSSSKVSTRSRAEDSRMGGFEQKSYKRGGSRVSLVIRNANDDLTLRTLADLSKDNIRTGTIYSLPRDCMEVVVEGEEESLKGLVEEIRHVAGASAELKEAWQRPVGTYQKDFPVIEVLPKMKADVLFQGNEQTLKYISNHIKIEAVFNRGLVVVEKTFANPNELRVVVKGAFKRLKSFVRWCYDGPPMQRANEVTVKWSAG